MAFKKKRGLPESGIRPYHP